MKMFYENGLYITTSSLAPGSGGGNVALHEARALQQFFEGATEQITPYARRLNVLCWDRNSILSGEVKCREIPEPAEPWLWDYLTMSSAEDINVKIAHIFGNPFGYTAKALKRNGAKIIVTVPAHNLEESIAEFKRFKIPYNYSHMTDPFLWSLYTKHIREADVVVCPSRMSAEWLKKKLGLVNRVVVIPHGCDLPAKVEPIPKNFEVAYTGQVGPDKGIIYLLQAWKIFQDSYPSEVLTLSGSPPEYYTPWLRFVPGINTSIPGYVPNVSQIYNNCSVYVQPSVTEGFGLEVLEAMSYGRPVIVSSGAGASDLVTDGFDGFIVPPRNPEAIADKLRYFRNQPELIVDMGKRAREKALNYSWDEIEGRYRTLYRETLR